MIEQQEQQQQQQEHQPSPHASHTLDQVRAAGPPLRPLDFPSPVVETGVRVTAFVIHPATTKSAETRQVGEGVLHKEEAPTTAYWPRRRLQDAIYGSVWACLVLTRHHGKASDDAARAAGMDPGHPEAPVVWEVTTEFAAIKMVEWRLVHSNRGRLLEDPVKEVAAMQLIGADHPHVLGSSQVLQDDHFLYSIMPYCPDGDLFGHVVKYAELANGDDGMPEPVARFWFKQILWGIHHLQSKGVCHRDLSLENILVNADKCLVIDMGMCLRVPYNNPNNSGKITDVTNGAMRRLMRPQGTCGKHNYMSPEVYNNTDNFDGFAIDLWSAGVILYIMLTGFPPYDNATTADQRFDLIISGRLVEQLGNWDIHLSDDAGNLMQQMLNIEPSERLTLAQIMAHPWVANGPEQPPPPPEPMSLHR